MTGQNYIVAYDLNAPGKNYKRLHDAIVQVSKWYAPLQKSLFFISAEGSRQDLYNFLKANMDSGDTLCVIEFTGATLDILKSLRDDLQDIIDIGIPGSALRLTGRVA